MPRPLAPPFVPATDAIISTLLPPNAAEVRFADPTNHVTCRPCSTAIILACNPDGRAPVPAAEVPASLTSICAGR